MVLFKGCLIFKQYSPSKRHHLRIKILIICECLADVILDFVVYTGRNIDILADKLHGHSSAVVKMLMQPYLGKSLTDNWHTSPVSTKFLQKNIIGSCGTVNMTCQGMPLLTTERGQQRSGTGDSYKSIKILPFRWHDKRDVNIVATVHHDVKVNIWTNILVIKPDADLDYMTNMHKVDRVDMQISEIKYLWHTCKLC